MPGGTERPGLLVAKNKQPLPNETDLPNEATLNRNAFQPTFHVSLGRACVPLPTTKSQGQARAMWSADGSGTARIKSPGEGDSRPTIVKVQSGLGSNGPRENDPAPDGKRPTVGEAVPRGEEAFAGFLLTQRHRGHGSVCQINLPA